MPQCNRVAKQVFMPLTDTQYNPPIKPDYIVTTFS